MMRRIDDLPAAEIDVLLGTEVKRLSNEEVEAIQSFIDRVGGFENAKRAVDLLCELERRAA